MILYDLNFVGLFGNTAHCPTCKAMIPDKETCVLVHTLDGLVVHCLRCGETIDRMEGEME